MVEGKVDGASQDRATVSVGQPVRQIPASLLRFRIAEHDRSFSSPEYPSTESTRCRAQVDEPHCSVTIVGIQGCRVQDITNSPENQGSLEAESVCDNASGQASECHGCEQNCITSPRSLTFSSNRCLHPMNICYYITRYGVCCPPAPTDCTAFHSPGAANAASPTMVALKKTPRRQLYLASQASGAPESDDTVSWTRLS